MIRIGTIRESDRRHCKENNLEWVWSFVCLGIKYNILDLRNITDDNIMEKMPLMENMIQLWRNRNITPVRRVTIWNSLIPSKVTRILMSLPSPNNAIMKQS